MPPRGQARILTAEELSSVIAIAEAGFHPERNAALLHMAFGLGLVAKDLAKMTCGQVARGAGRLRPALVWPDPDSGRAALPIQSTALRSSLRAHLQISHSGAWSGSRPLFVSQRGRAFSANSLQQVFARLFDTAGIEGASAWSGRYTFAAKLVAAGVSPGALATALGISVVAAARYYPVAPTTDWAEWV